MTMNQDVIIACVTAASKDIYHSAIRQYLIKHGDPRVHCGSLRPEKPEYEGVIEHTYKKAPL